MSHNWVTSVDVPTEVPHRASSRNMTEADAFGLSALAAPHDLFLERRIHPDGEYQAHGAARGGGEGGVPVGVAVLAGAGQVRPDRERWSLSGESGRC